MNNYSSWCSALQSIGSNLQTNNVTSPTTVNWNFPQPMQVQITTQINSNQNYQMIAREFMEKYAAANTLGVGCIGHYYNTNSLISVHIHHESSNILFEMVGHTNFKNKMTEIGIQTIKYHSLIDTVQPLGKNSILVSMYGKADINNTNCNILTTYVIRLIAGAPKIINQTLNIFV